MAGYALIVGRRLGLSKDALVALEQAVFLHDIGTIHIPDRILKKSEPLAEAEWKVMKSHVTIGYAMLSSIPGLEETAEVVLAHHERYDGKGYPHRLEGDDIPLGARICAVVDWLDTLTSDQPYHRAVGFLHACKQIAARRGTQFDPKVVNAFLSVPPWEWRQLQTSVVLPLEPEMVNETGRRPFRELVFSGHFDKPAPKVIAC